MKKLVCVPLYTKKFEYPVDLNRTYPNNSCGLCNQLTQVINLIANGVTHFYIDVFSTDLFKGKITPMSSILNLEAMNLKYGMDTVEMTEAEASDIREIY